MNHANTFIYFFFSSNEICTALLYVKKQVNDRKWKIWQAAGLQRAEADVVQ